MNAFQINLQTILFLTDNSVLGAYNENKKMLVYNKPLCQVETMNHILSVLKEKGKEVVFTYQTDSFGVNFYDPKSGGTSVFHEVKGTVVEGADPIEYNDIIPKEEFKDFLKDLKELDGDAYESESKDAFLDCYEYWTARGHNRFLDKVELNKMRLEREKA